MTFRFRLTAHNRIPGFFAMPEPIASLRLADGRELSVAPRDEDTLEAAASYHFEAGGFATEDEARQAGERLRRTLQILIAAFGLTLQVPTDDVQSSSISEALRSELSGAGVEVRNGRKGLSVFAEDGSVELVVAGHGRVRPSDPGYLLNAIPSVWHLDVQLDDQSKRSLELLALAASDVSPKTQFLMTYLAVEQLIPKGTRSAKAMALLQSLSEQASTAMLDTEERSAIVGSLGHLQDEPFSVAFRSFASRIQAPATFNGLTPLETAQRSSRLRNAIVHRAEDTSEDLGVVTSALRQFALTVIWTNHQLPPLNLTRPADTVSIDNFAHRLL